MTLTQERLKQIIKEELEAIVAEMGDEALETELSPEEQEVAALEQQLAEAKKKAEMGKKAAMKGKDKAVGKRMDVGIDGMWEFRPYNLLREVVPLLKNRPIKSEIINDHHTDEIVNVN